MASYGAFDQETFGQESGRSLLSLNDDYVSFGPHPTELSGRLVRIEDHIRAKANLPIMASDFVLPLATSLMFAGGLMYKFSLFPKYAGWCFVSGSAIFMFYGCQTLGGKVYRKCCGIKRDPLLPL